jgi:beta-galactosidase
MNCRDTFQLQTYAMRISLLLSICLMSVNTGFTQSIIKELSNWKFRQGDSMSAYQTGFNDTDWEEVKVPHDWAIYGPFDQEIDKQIVRIEQNNEMVATEKTGRTGALPFIGTGWYRTVVSLPEFSHGKKVLISFDGAMSHAEVFVNGEKVGERPYGYSYFYFDITQNVSSDQDNLIAVRLENFPFSSRWYPGAGLYRKVRIHIKDETGFKHWGHFVTTPFISPEVARVNIRSQVHGEGVSIKTIIRDADGKIVSENMADQRFGDEIEQNIAVLNPQLWSPDNPYLYKTELSLYQNDVLKEHEVIRFGIREIRYSAEKGFELNGKVTKFKGVCLHHDLGPIGSAVNKAALKRQLTILKDLGCNAIRSAHNMPSLEQLELCDEMGFMFIAESFDEWKKPKVKNGYNLYFDEWAEKDVVNLIQATRNHPCIVMWSAGNEVPDQWGSEGVKRLKWLQDIFHREDPTRPVTVGMDQVKAVMESGFAAVLDVPGLNYRVHLYDEAYEKFPQGFILGSETASTVSSRSVYKFPIVQGPDIVHDDLQSSSYDLEYCNWSNIPEDDFVLQDDKPWVIGEFVWTGFDYLGEPTPYDNYWPSRSSYFGMLDLAGIPKDRYYLYRSRWNTKVETLHLLPHWNWEGREKERLHLFSYIPITTVPNFLSMGKVRVFKKNHENPNCIVTG